VDYARFERLVIGVGAAAIVGTAALALNARTDPVEFVAQLLLLAVLVGAVRWGRRGGTVAAVGAIVVYGVAKWLSATPAEATAALWQIFALRAVMYAIVGVAGGEACSRMKGLFIRAHDARAIDETSSVFTPLFLAHLLGESIASYERYGLSFSVLVIAVDGRVTSGKSTTEAAAVVRTIAKRLRNGLRLVDDVGRLPWGAFAIILPQTGLTGAHTAGDRLRADLRETLGIEDAAITVRAICAGDDLDAIKALAAEADPAQSETRAASAAADPQTASGS
jgi:GGDEF domain-containing protein